MNKINFYIFGEIFRGFLLILFIFVSIAWLLQFTRLMSISNLLQIDTLNPKYANLSSLILIKFIH